MSHIRKVRVVGTITLPVYVELDVEVDETDDLEGQNSEAMDRAYHHVTRRARVVQFADRSIGFEDPCCGLGTPMEYTDNLNFEMVEDRE